MLYSLAQRGQAPSSLGRLSSKHVPAMGINVSAAVMLVGVVLNYEVPGKAFTWITSIAIIGTLWTWGIIMIAHRNYRRAVAAGRVRASSFRMPGAPLANWLVVAFLCVVTALLSLDPDTRVALYVAPFWFGILGVSYYLRSKAPPVQSVPEP
jgi:L-asparagine transporter-like permease